ncbi:MAG: hypothetical protein MZU97_11935 [Bacillus subtilis]|nr:hypothetical protein [Bacillus subtilis]
MLPASRSSSWIGWSMAGNWARRQAASIWRGMGVPVDRVPVGLREGYLEPQVRSADS